MRRKVILSLLSLLAIFVAGAVIASRYVAESTEEIASLLSLHEVETLRRDLVINIQTVQADLYTVHTPLAARLDSIVENVDKLETALNGCTFCHHTPAVAQEMSVTRGLFEEYKTALSYYITASANKDRVARFQLEADQLGDAILTRTEEMSSRATARLATITSIAVERINNIRIILLVTFAVMANLGVVVSWRLVNSVTRPVRRLVKATRILASGGLGHRIESQGEDEFGQLARNFNTMSAALEKSYEDLKDANVELRKEIQERKLAEEEREKLQSHLLHAQKMEALGTLSAGIAHEFGNLLHVIQACVDRVTAKSGADPPYRREIDLIAETVGQGSELTRGLLTFGRKTDNKLLPLDINKSVLRTKTILDSILPKSIAIELELYENLPLIQADATQIDQVLMNLAVNARDAMPEGGVLRIETRLDSDDSVSPRDSVRKAAGSQLVLRVSDTGHGIDDETRRHIFDPFFTTKEIGAGTGLGLATVYGIVAEYGGKIHCESEAGQGTTFEIRLPVHAEQQELPTTKSSSSKSRKLAGEATVLLVDDEQIVLQLLSENFEANGYHVKTAGSGEEAVALFEEHGEEIDLIMLDLGMPGMGGRACLDRLLQMDSKAKVIVSTGFGAAEDKEEMMRAGAAGFLAKPVPTSEILAKVAEVLDA